MLNDSIVLNDKSLFMLTTSHGPKLIGLAGLHENSESELWSTPILSTKNHNSIRFDKWISDINQITIPYVITTKCVYYNLIMIINTKLVLPHKQILYEHLIQTNTCYTVILNKKL